jgi:hypothetical protein
MKNINGFLNEMSYDLTMNELENIVIEYQPVIIDFIVNNQYNYKMKREFEEVCSVIRGNKFFKTISLLIQSEDDRINYDMAYILYTATHLSDDEELKGDAFMLGYRLRERELGSEITGHLETDIAILIASVKAIRSYNVTPFFRTKEVENILENLPEVLYNAYNEKYDAKQVNENVISAIITQAVLDVKAEEIITAFCKTDVDKNIKPEYKPYVTRLQAFIYKVCASVPEQLFMNALGKACNSINKYNERTNSNNTFMDKYLNYKLLEKLVQSKDVKLPQGMKTAYSRLTKFKNNNKKFEYIF